MDVEYTLADVSQKLHFKATVKRRGRNRPCVPSGAVYRNALKKSGPTRAVVGSRSVVIQFKKGGYFAMQRLVNSVFWGFIILLGMGSRVTSVFGHQAPHPAVTVTAQASSSGGPPAPGISGQGKMRFKLLYSSERLPEEAKKVLVSAHGGFAVDHRPGREETYFALP
ncbi:MAG: hypothetical protein DMG05_27585, partial [Acidobacteria bacterium]